MLDGRPKIILDGAHNPAAAQKVREYAETFLISTRLIMVFGAMRDKALHEMARLLFPLANHVVLTAPDHPRSAKPDEILKLVPEYATSVCTSSSVREALAIAEELANEEDIILIVGSLFLVGEAMELLDQRPSRRCSPLVSADAKE
jgi:dihydrofolate synthase/folylpolyglutamate synthase